MQQKLKTTGRDKFVFSNMKKSIGNILNNCIWCIIINVRRRKGQLFFNFISKEYIPLPTYNTDNIGPLPSTNKSYNQIFTVTYAFIKNAWLSIALKTAIFEIIHSSKYALQCIIKQNKNKAASYFRKSSSKHWRSGRSVCI